MAVVVLATTTGISTSIFSTFILVVLLVGTFFSFTDGDDVIAAVDPKLLEVVPDVGRRVGDDGRRVGDAGRRDGDVGRRVGDVASDFIRAAETLTLGVT